MGHAALASGAAVRQDEQEAAFGLLRGGFKAEHAPLDDPRIVDPGTVRPADAREEAAGIGTQHGGGAFDIVDGIAESCHEVVENGVGRGERRGSARNLFRGRLACGDVGLRGAALGKRAMGDVTGRNVPDASFLGRKP
jgi:hypothetical protein